MATLLFQAAGAALGGVFGPVGAIVGRAVGALAGSIVDRSLISEIITVSGDQAVQTAQRLPKTDGIFCGFSGGANVFAALQIAQRPESEGKLIVAIVPSFGERYLSTALFSAIRDEAAALPVVPEAFSVMTGVLRT